MSKRVFGCLLALSVAAAVLLSACTPEKKPPAADTGGALTWSDWNGYDGFLEIFHEKYPDVRLERVPYAGANRTGYSWAQLRADDIPDIFITSQILDGELAGERLADLSGYDFVNSLSTSVLDQVSVNGGVYLLPVNYGMYGIFYNKTLMEEKGWQVPSDFAGLEQLCQEIRAEGLIPGVLGTQLTGNTFSTVFNLAKTDWLTTPEGMSWERDFLAGSARAAGRWEDTMDYVQQYIDIGMFTTDPEDRNNPEMVLDYLGHRRAVFCTAVMTVNITRLPETGDALGMMPFLSRDGDKNIYMYSPTSYIGISRRLTEPGNEKKLENAVRLLSLLYSPEGQTAFITEQTPCVLSVLDDTVLPEDALIRDAQHALREGRAFPMTYANWENTLADMGQAFKEWFRGENGMDGPKCIARMDELQAGWLSSAGTAAFCESTADFTLEETGALVGTALGSAAGADAALVPIGSFYAEGAALKACITGRLYQGAVNTDIANSVLPGLDGEYALMTMTGAQLKELARTGFDAGSDRAFPYVLAVRGGGAPEDGKTYQVAFLMGSYTEETGRAFGARVEKGSIRTMFRDWLKEQGTVSPGGGSWN